jgi:hypothetical protein
MGFVNHAHSSFSELFQNLIVGNCCSDHAFWSTGNWLNG